MMTPEAILAVSAAVSLFVQLIKALGLPRHFGLGAVALVSLLAVGLWVYSYSLFDRTSFFSIFAGFGAVLAAAIGMYEGTKELAKQAGSGAAVVVLLLVPAIGLTPACGKRYVAGTTPQQAIAYELEQALLLLVDAQAQVIAKVDADPKLKPQADKFLNPVRDVLKTTNIEVMPRLKAFDAAMKAKDMVTAGRLRVEILPFLDQVNSVVQGAIGVSLPPGLISNIANLWTTLQEAIKNIRGRVTELQPA